MRACALLLVIFLAGPACAGEQLLWFQDNRLTGAGEQLLNQLSRADERGLEVSDYDAAALRNQTRDVSAGSVTEVARLDAEISRVASRIVLDLHQGRVKPSDLGYDLDVKRAPFDVGAIVSQLALSSDVAAALDSVEPQWHPYARLKQALARYRVLESRASSVTPLPALPQAPIRPGERYEGAPQLRQLLSILGDLPEPESATPDSEVLDPPLVDALIRFQARHGLEADGVLGRATFRALATPLSVRVRQIELSLERIRWLPMPLAAPQIIVNIPQFQLFAFHTLEEPARDILQMKVVVGDAFAAKRTPVFAAELRYVVLHPYWDVPRSILTKELLPQIRTRSGWLDAHDFEIVQGSGDDAKVLAPTADNIDRLAAGSLRLRQKPGPLNSLGRVKFMMPNEHDVYLHDTSAPGLFSRSRRAYSHGCIRVSDPMALLDYVMRDDETWSVERRDQALALDKPTRIALRQRIPVLILYGTALATEAGPVLFFEDIYAQDQLLLAKLTSR